jgi:hypothetical protein
LVSLSSSRTWLAPTGPSASPVPCWRLRWLHPDRRHFDHACFDRRALHAPVRLAEELQTGRAACPRPLARRRKEDHGGERFEVAACLATGNPDKATRGTAGVAAIEHIAGILLRKQTGMRFQQAPIAASPQPCRIGRFTAIWRKPLLHSSVCRYYPPEIVTAGYDAVVSIHYC